MLLTMVPLAFPIGVPELLIILAIVLLLFGGARLAGLGKSTGRALREFKEETKGLRDKDPAAESEPAPRPAVGPDPSTGSAQAPGTASTSDADLRKDA